MQSSSSSTINNSDTKEDTTGNKKKPAIRHAEKRRTSTCAFADRVANAALAVYRRVVLLRQSADPRQRHVPTCVAAILVHQADTDTLHVVALGVGTKFLTQQILQNEVDHERPYGRRVRDLHAEVLCRRAFRRYLSLCILQDLRRNEQHQQQDDDDDEANDTIGKSVQFLERTFDKNIDHDSPQQPSPQWRLRQGCTLHAYFSSTPCGNSTIKKFAKLSKEVFRPDLPQHAWPTDRHVPQQGHSMHLGQFALLLKRDATVAAAVREKEEEEVDAIVTKNEGAESATSTPTRRVSATTTRTEPKRRCTNGNVTAANVPIGTAPAESSLGSLHTCSDKVCRWNCLGWQGSLLASLLEEPLHMQSITVGRKFSKLCFQRAVCCRIAADTENKQPDSSSCVRHPAAMGTAVYVDPDAAVVPKTDPDENDMQFTSNRGYCWWPTTSANQAAHVIDGNTGLALHINNDGGDDYHESSFLESPICTHQLTHVFVKIQQQLQAGNVNQLASPECLADLRQFKQQASPNYETKKEKLFQHKVMKTWRRRWPTD